MTDKMKNLWIRTISGIVLFGIVFGATLWSEWSFGALLLAIIIGGQIEFYAMARKAGYSPQRVVGLLSGAVVFITAFAIMWLLDRDLSNGDSNTLAVTVVLILYIIMVLPMMFISELYRKSPTPIANIATTLMGIVYVAMPLSLMLFLPMLLGGEGWNAWGILFYIFIIWANDVFAYLFGITLGKHRLFERVSPKKSWEGFIGGLLGAMAMGYVASTFMNGNAIQWIGMALIAAITGVFGDLVESLFKRSVDVKDSGNIIPGHGGWLDRFDALIISAPFVFIYLVLCKLYVM